MKIATFTIECELRDAATLSAQKGSLLRGALGWALRKAVCTTTQKDCEACILYRTCLFPTFYAPQRDFFSQGLHAAKDIPPIPPPPFILSPTDTTKTQFAAGDILRFHLTLFGKFHTYLPYFVHAFTLMGEQGLGRATMGKRTRFGLRSILWQDQNIYDATNNLLLASPEATELALPLGNVDTGEISTFSVICRTPLRFKQANHLEASLPFVQLIRLTLRRLLALHLCYGDSRPHIDAYALLQAAERVKTVRDSLCWLDVARFSNRQQTRMYLGGVVGDIVYEGDYAFWQPWLTIISQVHLGKQTAFGYGHIETHNIAKS